MTAALAILALFIVSGGPTTTREESGQPVNKDARTIKGFMDRVEKFVALHRDLEETLPKLPKEAEADRLYAHQTALAKLIVQARAGARSGDLFYDDARKLFRRLISAAVRGPEGRQLVAAILDENTAQVPLRVNAPYPSDIPLSTVPPQVIASLPRLPEELEYRFVGRQLILFDRHAELIVDFMTNALP